MNSLSSEQTRALARFKEGHNLFITGPGGTGKTRLISHLVQQCRTDSKEYQVCAMTGCASILIGHGAKTLHSWSGMRLGRGTKAQIIASIRANPRAVKNWKKVCPILHALSHIMICCFAPVLHVDVSSQSTHEYCCACLGMPCLPNSLL